MRWRAISAVLVLATLGACSSGNGTARERPARRSAGDLALGHASSAARVPDVHRLGIAWSTTLRGEPGGVATDGAGVVTAETERGVTALDADGNEQWSTPVEGAGLGWPWAGEGYVVVPTMLERELGGCVALDRATGKRRWSYGEPGADGVAVAYAAGHVVCVMSNGVAVSIDLASGLVRWRAALLPPSARSYDVVDERSAIAIDTRSGVVAFTARLSHWAVVLRDLETGGDRGAFDLGTEGPPSAPVSLSPGVLAVGASNSSEVCPLDLGRLRIDGCVRVRAPGGFDPTSIPAVVGGLVVVTARDGSVAAVDLAVGKVRWSARTQHSILDAHPVVAGGVVMGADLTRVPWAVRLGDGAPVELPRTDGWVVATVADPHGGFVVAHRSLDGGRIERWVPAG